MNKFFTLLTVLALGFCLSACTSHRYHYDDGHRPPPPHHPATHRPPPPHHTQQPAVHHPPQPRLDVHRSYNDKHRSQRSR